MTKESQIKEMVKRVMQHFGRVDILVNNAGQGYDAPIEKIDIETFRAEFLIWMSLARFVPCSK